MTTAAAVTASLLPERPELSPARRRLFQTALALFSRDGYHGVSVRDIVGELDQHPTAIYAHVSSKQELLYELIKIGLEELRDRVRGAVLEAGSDPVAQVRAIVSANALTHLALPELARVTHAELEFLSAEQRALVEVIRVDLGGLFRDVVRRGIALGAFDPADVEVTLYAITAMGTRVVDWAPGTAVDAQHVAATHADLAIRMLTR